MENKLAEKKKMVFVTAFLVLHASQCLTKLKKLQRSK